MSEPVAAPVTPTPRHQPAPLPQRWRLRLAIAVAVLVPVGVAAATLVVGQRHAYRPVTLLAKEPADPESEAQLDDLRQRLEARWPRGVFIVVDTYHNRLRLYQGSRLIHEAVCSSGSRGVLRDPETGRIWVFETPRGEHRVRNKVKNPVWVKPDWAFIEEGERPPTDRRDRLDEVSLGDYGLYLGDGYIIHGTLFQTLLGQGVTHGCIRLGDADLELVYRHAPLGARVYLY